MSKNLDVSQIDTRKLKISVLVCNLVIAAICLTAMITLLFGNFWTVSMALTLNDEILHSVAGDSGAEDGGQAGQFNFDTSMLTKEDRTLKFSLNLTGSTMLSAVAGQNTAIISHVIDDQMNALLDQLLPVVAKVTKFAVKGIVSTLVEELKQTMQGTDEEIAQQLKEMGIEPEKLSGQIDGIMDELLSEKPDTEQVKQDIVGIITNVMGDTVDQGAIDQFTEIYDKLITENLDADGSLNIVKILEQIVSAVKQDGSQASVKLLSAGSAASAAESETIEQMRNAFLAKLDQNTINSIGLAVRIMGIVLLAVIVAWGYILLKLFVKLFVAKNKTVRLSLACFLGFLLFAVLVILPWILMSFVAPHLVSPADLPMLNSLSLAFASVSLISFICTLLLFVLWAVIYRSLRKRSKALVRAGMLDRKII